MVKTKNTKLHTPILAKRAKQVSRNAASSSSAATLNQDRKTVDPTKLAWSTVHLPSEAQSGGAGVTQSDFFNSLNWNDDDFMGLQEIDDVDVVQEQRADGSRTISFLAADKKLKSKRKHSQVQQIPESAQKAAPMLQPKPKPKQAKKRTIEQVEEPTTENTKDASESTKSTKFHDQVESEEEYETAADITMPAADDAAVQDSDLEDDDLAEAFRNAHHLDLQDDQDDDAEFDNKLLPKWSHLPLHSALKRALARKGFKVPTEIQNRSLPFALGLQQQTASSDDSEDAAATLSSSQRKRDVVGVSQTGSGKTLAYGLPVLNYLFENAESAIASSSLTNGTIDVPPPLGALILCPTRELALQVSSHLTDLVRASCLVSDDEAAGISHKKLLRRPQIAVVCGGMSEQKQRRLLEGRSRKGDRKAGVDIIVATPGRLWEMTRLDDHLAARIKQTRFLVLDEADRMVEVGHFAEMEHILNLVNRSEAKRPSEGQDGQQNGGSDDESESCVEAHGVKPSSNMQTFIFSATLSKALQVNLKRRRKLKQFIKKRHSKRKENATTLDELMDRVDFRDDSPAVIDLSSGQGLPEGLLETKIECVGKDKDLYLYYFLLRYPGRSLVFVNSIDGIRRLTPIMAQLNITAYPIHSQLQQKQRLKNLDRFRAFNRSGRINNCVLLATDVAARGLDIPSVEHVVHFQLPRSADTYVHRSGRTARAGSSGVSLALIEPKEKTLWAKLCRAMGRKVDIPTFPVTFSTLGLLRERVELALAIDKQTHEANKQAHDDEWLAKLAEEADLAMSDDDVDPDAPRQSGSKARNGKETVKLNEMKSKLAALLAQPITTKGLSHRYLTATGLQGSAWVDDMIREKSHEQILGVQNTDAQTDLQSRQQQPAKKKLKTDKVAASMPDPAKAQDDKMRGGKAQRRKIGK
ncbi:related to MAK5 - ATP-dependent RNA helicase [Melanopsichium pennsylvanicum]|uniref:ATP-dependent RNA helicase n=2 Tax=Melanopsichium pennsylvanicum TaxID=63383 RepID=A0AAJ5C2L8_9BASI|nr:related to MAK5-ATP-dependent RNA helicase [Melanopsichium pennsylvanicum 4]SNX81554.1 related to MAK5 - ATP-dependent RNA helicase [Melanopsichium pennsylvanicum]